MADSEGYAERRATCPATRHNARRPPAHTPSRSARNGRPGASAERFPVCRTGSLRSAHAGADPLLYLHQLVPELAERCEERLGTSPHQHVGEAPLVVQPREQDGPPDLPQAPPQAVPLHGGSVHPSTRRRRLAPRLRHDQSQAGMQNGGSGDEDIEVACLPPLPPSEQLPNLLRGGYPGGPRQSEPATPRGGFAAERGGLTRVRATAARACPRC
jgi:hypothetical protein